MESTLVPWPQRLRPPRRPGSPLAASSSSPGGLPRLRPRPCERRRCLAVDGRTFRATALAARAGRVRQSEDPLGYPPRVVEPEEQVRASRSDAPPVVADRAPHHRPPPGG